MLNLEACPLCDSMRCAKYKTVRRTYLTTNYVLELSKCAECGFVFLANDPAIPYDEDYLENELVLTTTHSWTHFKTKERLAAIQKYVPPNGGASFLDIGIGDGLLLSMAEQAGYLTFGLDVNPAGVDQARKRYGLKSDIRTEPLESAFPGEKFDVVHYNEVIEHVRQPLVLLRWSHEHLAEKGLLIIQTGNIDSLASRLKGEVWDYYRPMHVSYFSTTTLAFALRRAGFVVRRICTVDWRLRAVVGMSRTLAGSNMSQAVGLLGLYFTALRHGVRRTVIVYATCS